MSRPLHFGGTARYRSESQRPDLWPAWSVNPVMGITGMTLIDIVGKRNSTLVNMDGSDWVSSPYGPVLDFDGTNDYAQSDDFDSINIGNSSSDKPFTIFMQFKVNDLNTRYLLSHSLIGSSTSFQWIVYTRSPDNTLAIALYDSDGSEANNWVRRMVPISAIVWYNCFITYDGSGGNTAYNGIQFYLNGIQGSGYTDTLNGTYVAAHSLSGSKLTIGGGRVRSSTAYMNGQCGGVSVWPRVLSGGEITALSSDPLLPFRRKTMISLYVPSGAPATSIPVIMNHYRRLRTA